MKYRCRFLTTTLFLMNKDEARDAHRIEEYSALLSLPTPQEIRRDVYV